METLIKIIDFILIGLLVIFPFLVLKRLKKNGSKRIFLRYILISLPLLAILLIILAWWNHESKIILMNYYGFDIESDVYSFESDGAHFDNVSEENMERVRTLHTSVMGIGWPLHAIFAFPFLTIYLLFAYPASFAFNKIKNQISLSKFKL